MRTLTRTRPGVSHRVAFAGRIWVGTQSGPPSLVQRIALDPASAPPDFPDAWTDPLAVARFASAKGSCDRKPHYGGVGVGPTNCQRTTEEGGAARHDVVDEGNASREADGQVPLHPHALFVLIRPRSAGSGARVRLLDGSGPLDDRCHRGAAAIVSQGVGDPQRRPERPLGERRALRCRNQNGLREEPLQVTEDPFLPEAPGDILA